MWFLVLALLGLGLLYRWHRQSQMLENLSDKYVFITGCDTGFGNILAKQLDKRGMKVLASCLTAKGAEKLKTETSSRLQTTILDISDSKNVSSTAEWVSSVVKDKGLWGLVNYAAIPGQMAPLGWQKKNDFVKVLDVNVLGMIDVTLTLMPLVRRAQGRIVNVSSIAGRLALIPGGYNISKYGVEVFSDTLRQELNDFGVKVSIVEPGAFNTSLTILPLIKKSIEDKWQALPAETKKIYGEEYFKKCLQDLLEQAFRNGIISEHEKNFMTVDDPRCPCIYLLPKGSMEELDEFIYDLNHNSVNIHLTSQASKKELEFLDILIYKGYDSNLLRTTLFHKEAIAGGPYEKD